MAQADGVVANGTGSAVRSDINNQYAALWSNHSGSTEPSSGKVAYQTWADTNSGYLKIRNAANNGWVTLFKLDGTDICRLTGSTNNQITTVTGANAIQGEANLTFDGSNLGVGETSPDKLIHLSGNNTSVSANAFTSATNTIRLTDTDTSVTSNQPGGTIEWETLDSSAAGVNAYIATKNSNTGYGSMHFGTGNASTLAERMSIHTDGNVTIADGDLVIGTSGHGIDFSATAGTGTSELLADYEEGSFTPTWAQGVTGITYSIAQGHYTKIGRYVYGHIYLYASVTGTNSDHLRIGGLPFTSGVSTNVGFGGGHNTYTTSGMFSGVSGGDSIMWHVLTQNTLMNAYSPTGFGVAGNTSGVTINNKEVLLSFYYFTA